MKLAITGATGFVMSVLGRHWLEVHPSARLVVLDAAPLDPMAERFFAPVADRLDIVTADVTRPESWRPMFDRHEITHAVHGATITPLSRGTVAEALVACGLRIAPLPLSRAKRSSCRHMTPLGIPVVPPV